MHSPNLDRQAEVQTEPSRRQDWLAEATAAVNPPHRPLETVGPGRRRGKGAPSPADELPELMTAKQLEAVTQINVKTIYGYVRRGLIPYVRIQSNVRFRRAEIRDWIERNSFRPR